MRSKESHIVEPLIEPLTRREREILALLAQGYSGPEIAKQLTLAISSVKWHIQQVYGKLGVNSKRQALTRAQELGLLETSLPTTPPESPPAPTTTRHNLPLQLTHFIGRAQQIAEVRRLLRSTRLLTLTGPGGTGKTRLALQIGEESLSDFSHGVWLVELAPIAEPTQVPQAVTQALALRAETAESESASRDALSLIVEHLSRKRLLLILDNCEHLVMACAQLAEQLLRAAPGLHILTTSREALGVGGERNYPVPALSVPEPGTLPPLETLAQSEAVQLFSERAAAARPNFGLTDENAQAVVQICQRLDGIPLAIELAAARAQALSVEQIAALLDDRFHLLTGGNRTAPPRQQTLRGAIDWSYELLSDEERALLRRLSVFADGWSLEAATHMLGKPEALDWLAQLVAKSLVLSEQLSGQVARFRMLETIREYAQEKLVQANEEEAARRQHLAFYVALAEQAEPELRRHGQAKWRYHLDRERDNLRAALRWALKTEDAEAALRLAGALPYYWTINCSEAEGRRWLEAALELQTNHGSHVPKAWQAKALLGAGWQDRNKDLNVSLSRLEKGLAIYQQLGSRWEIAYALNLLGSHYRAGEQNYPRALELYQQALDLWMETEDDWGIGVCLHWMGHAVEGMGERTKAEELFRRSVEILRHTGDSFQLQWPLDDLAKYYFSAGDLVRSRTLYEKNLAAFVQFGGTPSFNQSLNWLTYTSILLGDYAEARVIALDMQNLREGRETVAAGRVYLGQIALLQGQPAEAQPHFEAAFKIYRDINSEGTTSIATSWVQPWLACVTYHLGDLERAKTLLHDSIGGNSPDQDHSEIRHALLVRGDVAWAQGDVVAAAEYYARSLKMAAKYYLKWDVADRLERFAKLAAAQQPQRAARLFGAASALREQMSTPIPPIERPDYEQAVALARAQLDPAAFDAAWAEGQAMGWEQAAAYALESATDE